MNKVLVIAGEHDVIKKEHTEMMGREIPGSRAEQRHNRFSEKLIDCQPL